MTSMRRLLLFAVAIASLLTASVAAEGQSRSSANIQATVKITQGVTKRIPHPPDGDTNDVFSVVLTLFAIKPAFGKTEDQRIGDMTFSYVLHGKCGSFGEGCKGTVDVQTRTRLPDGTLTAIGNALPIRAPFIVTINKGTGRYAGAKGRILIAPEGQPRNVFEITVP
jgi:hypothetical protein